MIEYRKKFLFIVIKLTVLTFLSIFVDPAAFASVYYQESADGRLILGNDDFYEISFNRENGGIIYIIDKTAGEVVSPGTRNSSLWAANFNKLEPLVYGGNRYHLNGSDKFTYSWSDYDKKLVFNYTPAPNSIYQIKVKVEITFSDNNYIDMKMDIHNGSEDWIDWIFFPARLLLEKEKIQDALMPILPGIILRPEFFANDVSFNRKYPGYPGMFSDFISINVNNGHLALYSIYRKHTVDITLNGFDPDEFDPSQSMYNHFFAVRLKSGLSWQSPVVRLRVSGDHRKSIESFRIDNEYDKSPSLREKLGPIYTKLVNSLLYKTESAKWGVPFSEYENNLKLLPKPGILHLVNYEQGGFNTMNPDFLPPDEEYGTTEEMARMIRTAQDLGLLVMPYINPTWWNPDSPTMLNLPSPLMPADLAVLRLDGRPLWEVYGSGSAGLTVSPFHPFVVQRNDQLMRQMKEDLPSDLIFEDQIGARGWRFDHNPLSPTPIAYIDGWVEHVKKHRDKLLMTELGFDRIIDYEVGFNGSILLPWKTRETGGWLGGDTWSIYPFAPMIARDKVLFYQHDLAPETMTWDRMTLTWNLSMGSMLSFDLYWGGPQIINNPWLQRILKTFQQRVLSKYADERIEDYTYIDKNVTLTRFRTFSVVANWDDYNTYQYGNHIIAPKGALVMSDDDAITAGIFSGYNGTPLQYGEHIILEERYSDKIVLYHLEGWSTDITLKMLPDWKADERCQAMAFDKDGNYLGKGKLNVIGENLVLYSEVWRGNSIIDHYVITPFEKQKRVSPDRSRSR